MLLSSLKKHIGDSSWVSRLDRAEVLKDLVQALRFPGIGQRAEGGSVMGKGSQTGMG